jgi:glycosyltransferase involved in cell wall biosynthesis
VRVRVLHVIDGLEVGGAQSALVGILKLADANRFEMYVANVGRWHEPALVDEIRRSSTGITMLNARALWDARAIAALARTIRRERIDLVHTHLAAGDVLGGLAAKLTRRPVVSMLQNVARIRDTYRLPRRLLADFAIRHLADRLIAVGEAVKDTHARELHLDVGRFEVVPNFPSAPLFLPEQFEAKEKRRELGIEEGPLACVASRLNEQRDHGTLLRALPAVLSLHPKLTVAMLGNGPRLEELIGLARDLRVDASVLFLGTRFDAVEIMAASDLFCQPTLYEGLSVAVLEAMSLGLPVVASEVDGVVELIDDGRTGLLVPPGDAEELAGALIRLLGNAAERKRIGDAARREIFDRYEPRESVRRIERVYLDLVT